MRAIIQRVIKASVSIENKIVTEINEGLVILLGIEVRDTKEDAFWLANKIAQLRIFRDDRNKMNHSILDTNGDVLVVSQFTLHAKTKKGNRPSYIRSASNDQAVVLYEQFKKDLYSVLSKEIYSGKFGANMKIKLINDGPVTIIIDTKDKE
ncbi:MAG: D-tyrosyl-tRNA(Tyr) deacylase [Flavobacteriales bacterium]|nr:D-tyrosyl-tRNA(Tyr) deacylase [Flavobacteriales bacterium]